MRFCYVFVSESVRNIQRENQSEVGWTELMRTIPPIYRNPDIIENTIAKFPSPKERRKIPKMNPKLPNRMLSLPKPYLYEAEMKWFEFFNMIQH